ncbi:ClpXP adapter SpxH family protein [Alkalihalobacillus sp. BA299]|uniref:ClpXP adapter SpxH family protein n=1 Tax=Alkalihalobacillus sp. BA299 TaxID=2815938 RepID=UPI0027DB6631|nr:ClpXP adapter SpxH family protein [Alkalihalobacillus sp. BA299]
MDEPSVSKENNCVKKPLEIYIFIDPLCPECWAFEPMLKKLQVEYGKYFKIRYFVAGSLEYWNKPQAKTEETKKLEEIAKSWEKTASRTGMSCDGDLWFEDPITSPYTASIAIKAAEMQGQFAAMKFLRRLRELLFLDKKNISKEDVLIECANKAGLDVDEFIRDLHSEGAVKALQCDVKMTKELSVDYSPTFVFFNDNIEDEGLKVTGFYPYEIFVEIIQQLLGYSPEPSPSITLEEFLSCYSFVATKEVAVVFNISIQEAERKLKRMMLQQQVERVPVKHGTFWRYITK